MNAVFQLIVGVVVVIVVVVRATKVKLINSPHEFVR